MSQTGTVRVVCTLHNQAEYADAALTVGVMDPALTRDDGWSSDERFMLPLSVKLTHGTQRGLKL